MRLTNQSAAAPTISTDAKDASGPNGPPVQRSGPDSAATITESVKTAPDTGIPKSPPSVAFHPMWTPATNHRLRREANMAPRRTPAVSEMATDDVNDASGLNP